jgi:hypothetical protein
MQWNVPLPREQKLGHACKRSVHFLGQEPISLVARSLRTLERHDMTSSARIFFAGVGTTFAILIVGFGGGLMMAKSAVQDRPVQLRANSEQPPGVRVVLPASAEPATPASERPAAVEPIPQIQPVQNVRAAAEQQVETPDPKKAKSDLKAERRRYAERKAKRIAAARARLQLEPQQRTEPSIMAFGGDVSRTSFFGN